MYRFAVRGAIALAVIAPLAALSRPSSREPTVVPEAAVTSRLSAAPGVQTIVLAGGCFWGIEAVFEHIKGVTDAVSGYAGGTKEQADYETVSTGTTGHAESVKVTFDPTKVSLEKLLQVFFSVAHDPTQLNRQGPDSGPQYHSAIFTTNDEQRKVAEAYIAQLNAAKVYRTPIVTRVGPLDAFYPAEAYHQDYAVKHPDDPYIVINDRPKVDRLQKQLPALYREQRVAYAAAAAPR